jgi:hypothetical protein
MIKFLGFFILPPSIVLIILLLTIISPILFLIYPSNPSQKVGPLVLRSFYFKLLVFFILHEYFLIHFIDLISIIFAIELILCFPPQLPSLVPTLVKPNYQIWPFTSPFDFIIIELFLTLLVFLVLNLDLVSL